MGTHVSWVYQSSGIYSNCLLEDLGCIKPLWLVIKTCLLLHCKTKSHAYSMHVHMGWLTWILPNWLSAQK